MGTILKFPVKPNTTNRPKPNPPSMEARSSDGALGKDASYSSVASKLVHFVAHPFWILTLLLWPILRWVIAIDVAFYGFMTALEWDNPATNYGSTFIGHFLAFSALTYFITNYKSKKN